MQKINRREKEMKAPYLIQRAKFEDRSKYKTGIDSILSFDYMGSAEFEFGALPESLKRIRENISDYIYIDIPFENKIVSVFCNNKDKPEMKDTLTNVSKNYYRLKEYCDFVWWIGTINNILGCKCQNDFWWDIDNDFMFWKKNVDFETKFKQLIEGK